MERNAVIYCLSTEGDVDRLRTIAADRGYPAPTVLTDTPASATGRGAGHAALVRMIGKGGVHTVLVSSLTMLGSGVDDLVKLVSLMASNKIALIVEAEGIDTTRPDGRAWLATMVLLQRYQVSLRHRKARAGQLRAKEAGVRFGRPPVPENVIHNIKRLLAEGVGVRSTARRLGISPTRVGLEKQAMMGATANS